jgi:hypothetical protein
MRTISAVISVLLVCSCGNQERISYSLHRSATWQRVTANAIHPAYMLEIETPEFVEICVGDNREERWERFGTLRLYKTGWFRQAYDSDGETIWIKDL